MPGFFGPLFLPSNSPSNGNFLLKLHSNCMFFSHFCHNYHQNYHNYHHNYHCNHHYHHQKKIGHTRKTSFLTSKKEDQVAQIGVRGGGLGDSNNARKKTFFFYGCLPLWQLMATFGSLWQLMAAFVNFGNTWQLLARYGYFEQLMPTFGSLWQFLKN